MTEAEWLACDDPYEMIVFAGDRLSDRKTRLAYCALWRHDWQELLDPIAGAVVDVAERFADGTASEEERQQAWEDAHRLGVQRSFTQHNSLIAVAKTAANCLQDARDLFNPGYLFLQESTAHLRRDPNACRFLREVYGFLRFRPVSLDLTWLTSTVVSLAMQIYESKDFSAMPILADALMDAGCSEPMILAHCRSESLHVRGCWVLDSLLGKE